ncbi:MAG TPA: HEPN domain-containing protein [Candidatus Anaerostipes excrementavium]|uniref:HEPN domain-containing protein n=1 Tax=Candidatus Anaerostipes excrementavium TaxID=2838463 RepID=A0A9D1WWG1_9FIRM|nr:HEPN domain-containing protein [uncultured Anaerostipes sp.]HIX68513.1 HEPN domain-containing protein [Candidatus Anaerostipes excrementavium]
MPDYQKELVEYRLQTAEEKLHSAKILLDAGEYKDSIGRSYYAMFSAVRAILALDKVDFSKHAGVIAYFQKEYVKTRKFDKKYSKYISNAFQIRNNCDYTDFFLVSKNDALEQYEKAVEFIEKIKIYLLPDIE